MPENNLASLPTELLYYILSYSTGCSAEENQPIFSKDKPKRLRSHIKCPLYTVASTCRQLRDVVESFTKHLLLQHNDATGFSSLPSFSLKYVPAGIPRKSNSHRVAWVKWMLRNCAFCGKSSSRRALMNDAFHCCQSCDKKEWPDKIIMTNALKDYNLTKLDLFTPNPLFPDNRFPKLRFAIYDCVGVETTLFMRDEVAARAKLIHGSDGPEEQKLRKKRRTRIEKSTHMKVLRGRWSYMPMDDEPGRWYIYNPKVARMGLSSEDTDNRLNELIQKERAEDNIL